MKITKNCIAMLMLIIKCIKYVRLLKTGKLRYSANTLAIEEDNENEKSKTHINFDYNDWSIFGRGSGR